MSEISTDPAAIHMATTDVLPLEVDMTAQLPAGGSVGTPACTLTDRADGTVVTLADEPVVAGNVVTQPIRGSALTARHVYQLRVVYAASESVTLTTVTEIVVLL